MTGSSSAGRTTRGPPARPSPAPSPPSGSSSGRARMRRARRIVHSLVQGDPRALRGAGPADTSGSSARRAPLAQRRPRPRPAGRRGVGALGHDRPSSCASATRSRSRSTRCITRWRSVSASARASLSSCMTTRPRSTSAPFARSSTGPDAVGRAPCTCCRWRSRGSSGPGRASDLLESRRGDLAARQPLRGPRAHHVVEPVLEPRAARLGPARRDPRGALGRRDRAAALRKIVARARGRAEASRASRRTSTWRVSITRSRSARTPRSRSTPSCARSALGSIDSARALYPRVKVPEAPAGEVDAAALTRVLRDLCTACAPFADGRPPPMLLVLDELEQVLAMDALRAGQALDVLAILLGRLRNALGESPSPSGAASVGVLLCGALHPLLWAPLRTLGQQSIMGAFPSLCVPCLSPEAASSMMRGLGGRQGIRFADEALDLIIEQSQGVPLLLRRVGTSVLELYDPDHARQGSLGAVNVGIEGAREAVAREEREGSPLRVWVESGDRRAHGAGRGDAPGAGGRPPARRRPCARSPSAACSPSLPRAASRRASRRKKCSAARRKPGASCSASWAKRVCSSPSAIPLLPTPTSSPTAQSGGSSRAPTASATLRLRRRRPFRRAALAPSALASICARVFTPAPGVGPTRRLGARRASHTHPRLRSEPAGRPHSRRSSRGSARPSGDRL